MSLHLCLELQVSPAPMEHILNYNYEFIIFFYKHKVFDLLEKLIFFFCPVLAVIIN